jgi:ACS family tartrate transporter-like MFS transporter
MIINSRHSDKTQERRGHVAAVYALSGTSLILSVLLRQHFWLSYALLCLAIPGPFAAMGPFWAAAGEALPVAALGVVCGIVNAFGNLGGYAGSYVVGWFKQEFNAQGADVGTAIGFSVLGVGMLICVALAFMLPKPNRASPNPTLAR